MLYSISYPLVILFLYLFILFFRTGLICMRQAFFSKLFNSLFTKFLFLLLTLSLKRWRYKVPFSFIGFIIWLLSMRRVGLPTFVLTYQRWGAWRQPTTSKCPSRLNSYLSSISSLDIGVCYLSMRRWLRLPTFVLTHQLWGAWRRPTTNRSRFQLNS